MSVCPVCETDLPRKAFCLGLQVLGLSGEQRMTQTPDPRSIAGQNPTANKQHATFQAFGEVEFLSTSMVALPTSHRPFYPDGERLWFTGHRSA